MIIADNTLWVSGSDIIISKNNPMGIIPKGTYDTLVFKKRINVISRGCRNNPAQIEYDSLPPKLRQMYAERFGDPLKCAIQRPIVDTIKADHEALAFYSRYELASGKTLLASQKLTRQGVLQQRHDTQRRKRLHCHTQDKESTTSLAGYDNNRHMEEQPE